MVSFNRGSTVCAHDLPGGCVDHIFMGFLKCGTAISDHNVPFELPPSQLEVGYTIALEHDSLYNGHHPPFTFME